MPVFKTGPVNYSGALSRSNFQMVSCSAALVNHYQYDRRHATGRATLSGAMDSINQRVEIRSHRTPNWVIQPPRPAANGVITEWDLFGEIGDYFRN